MGEPLSFQRINIQHIEVGAAIPPRVGKYSFSVGRQRKRSFMPVLGFGQLLRLCAVNGDAPQMAIVLIAPQQEVDGVALRGKGDLLNQALSVIQKLVVAGPFGDNGNLRGIFVFRVASLDEAKQLSATDPAVQAGRFVVDVHPWMVPAGVLP